MKKLKEMMIPEREEPINRALNGEAEKKKGKFMDQTNLPHHVVTYDILTRLPIKTLMQFKCVSKQWYSTISSYEFTNTHFKLSPFSHPSSPVHCLFIQWGGKYYLFDCEDYERRDTINDDISKCLVELKVDFGERKDHLFLVGSCNGLLCLASYWGKIFIIWNPSICQWKKFEDPYALNFGDCWSAWGFGYVSSVNDYKVVRILHVTKTSEIQVHVFSLRTNRWTRIDADILQDVIIYKGTLPKFPSYVLFLRKLGVLVNETLYWTVTKSTSPGRYVVAFDLVHETVDIVRHVLQDPPDHTSYFLFSLGGNLCKYQATFGETFWQDETVDVTVNLFMQPEQEEVVGFSSNAKLMRCGGVVGFTRMGNLFFLLEAGEIGVFNLKSSEMKYPHVLGPDIYQDNTGIASYVPSAISPLTIAELPKN